MNLNYAAHLENKLIKEFKQKFYEKLGYVPVVMTRVKGESEDEQLPILTLEELESCFESLLPKRFGTTLRLGSKNRKRELVELRNIFCALARMMGYTFTDIGKHLGGRDHTTAIHNVNTFKDLIKVDQPFQSKYNKILTYIKLNYESPDLGEFDQTQLESEPALLP